MTRALIFGLLSFVTPTIFSCAQKKNKPTQNTPIIIEKKISISSVGSLQFTRSYSETQDMTDQKRSMAYIDKVNKSNPAYIESRSDSLFLPLFQNLGLVKGDELLLSKFNYSKNPDTSITDISGEKISFHLIRDTLAGINDRIVAFSNGDSSVVKYHFHFGIKYAFIEVIVGGNKELVVLTEHWLMGTEIYTLDVLEIKKKD